MSLSGPTILEVVGKVERSNLALIDDGATVIEDDDGDYKLVQETLTISLYYGSDDDAADPHHMLLIHYVHLAENKTWKPEAQCLGNSPACDRGKFCVDEP